MTTPPEFPAEEPVSTPSELASWGTRAVGYIIDFAPIWILSLLTIRSNAVQVLVSLVGLAYFIYIGWLEGTTGQSPGKAIMGIRLVNQQGSVIGGGMGIGRKFAHILDSVICMLGWFLPLVDSKRQTIADKVVSTFVVSGQERKAFAVDLWTPPSSQA